MGWSRGLSATRWRWWVGKKGIQANISYAVSQLMCLSRLPCPSRHRLFNLLPIQLLYPMYALSILPPMLLLRIMLSMLLLSMQEREAEGSPQEPCIPQGLYEEVGGLEPSRCAAACSGGRLAQVDQVLHGTPQGVPGVPGVPNR